MSPNAAACRSVGRLSAGVARGSGSADSRYISTYRASPSPAASESTTNASRTTVDSTPMRSPRPPATPATTRSPALRVKSACEGRAASSMAAIVAQPTLRGTTGFDPETAARRDGSRSRERSGWFPDVVARGCRTTLEPMEPTNDPRTLVRRTDRRLIAGVAGGLGDHFGVRAGWFRLGFVLAALAGGMGVVAYLLLWFLIPRADLPRSAAQQTADRFPDAPAWAGIVLIGIGVVSLTSQLGIHLGSVAWALLLIGGGLLLYRRGGGRRSALGRRRRSRTRARIPARPSPCRCPRPWFPG